MVGFEIAGDVVHGLAFADRERNFVDLAFGELPENVAAG